MPGRMLGAEAAAGAKMNKGNIAKIAVVSVLAMLLLTAAPLPFHDADQLIAFVASDSFLMICVVSQLTTIGFLAWFAAMPRTPASRRSYEMAIVASVAQLAVVLYMVFFVRRFVAEVQDTA